MLGTQGKAVGALNESIFPVYTLGKLFFSYILRVVFLVFLVAEVERYRQRRSCELAVHYVAVIKVGLGEDKVPLAADNVICSKNIFFW